MYKDRSPTHFVSNILYQSHRSLDETYLSRCRTCKTIWEAYIFIFSYVVFGFSGSRCNTQFHKYCPEAVSDCAELDKDPTTAVQIATWAAASVAAAWVESAVAHCERLVVQLVKFSRWSDKAPLGVGVFLGDVLNLSPPENTIASLRDKQINKLIEKSRVRIFIDEQSK